MGPVVEVRRTTRQTDPAEFGSRLRKLRGSAEASSVIRCQSLDLGFGQLRCNEAHAAIDVVSPFARRIIRELSNEIFRILFGKNWSFNRPARARPMTRRARRYIPAWIP